MPPLPVTFLCCQGVSDSIGGLFPCGASHVLPVRGFPQVLHYFYFIDRDCRALLKPCRCYGYRSTQAHRGVLENKKSTVSWRAGSQTQLATSICLYTIFRVFTWQRYQSVIRGKGKETAWYNGRDTACPRGGGVNHCEETQSPCSHSPNMSPSGLVDL